MSVLREILARYLRLSDELSRTEDSLVYTLTLYRVTIYSATTAEMLEGTSHGVDAELSILVEQISVCLLTSVLVY